MKFTAAEGVEVKELSDDEKLRQLKEKFSLNDIYKRIIFNRLKGDKYKITMFTLAVMLMSEVPIYFFTLLDILKLESLFKFRLHYIKEQTEHLGIRNYPPLDVIIKTAKDAEFNFFFAYWVPAGVAMKIGSMLGIYVYDTEEGEKKVTWWRFFKELLMISVLADLGFYWMHRMFHQPQLYLDYHKKHHMFKYSIALAHHWMDYREALAFILPQALPPILLWALLGRKMHITSMWGGVFFSQINAILGHAGYRIPGIPTWLPFLQADYHDFHHVDYSGNFGAIFPIIDWIFGTYIHGGVETNMSNVIKNKPLSSKAYDIMGK